jgi:hypothetical protein
MNGAFAIKGTCIGDAFIFNSDAVIGQDVSGGSIATSLIVEESAVTLNTITLDGSVNGDNQGIQVNGSAPGGTALKPASVSLTNVTVNGYPDSGISVHGNSTLLMSGGTVSGSKNCGIFADINARVELSGVEVTGNGTDPADGLPGDQCGIHAEYGATVLLTNSGNIHDNNGAALWLSHATADLENSTLSSSSPASFPAIVGQRGSLNLVNDTIAGGIFADSGTAITSLGSTISQNTAADPAIFASDGSQFVSLGGNTISNSVSGALALTLQNGSLYHQRDESILFGPLEPDQIAGSAFVQVQSSLEIGAGLVSGAPSLVWALPTGNCILIQQNSSIRVSGGVEIDGAPPAVCTLNGGNVSTSIVIQQESNGFFNVGIGGTDAFTGGGGVSCTFTSFPNAHVAGKGNISPPSAQPAIIGNLSQALTATSPGCLGP